MFPTKTKGKTMPGPQGHAKGSTKAMPPSKTTGPAQKNGGGFKPPMKKGARGC